MTRYALAAVLLVGSFGAAVAAEPTPSTSQLALQIRACNQIDDVVQRESCKTNAREEATYKVRTPYREPGRFERTYK
ncbi:MAG: hypothetical protein JNM30_08735 [Rhodospirillales bacterium]|nr:hypothetical protein [Rhodospirillales bacterium]